MPNIMHQMQKEEERKRIMDKMQGLKDKSQPPESPYANQRPMSPDEIVAHHDRFQADVDHVRNTPPPPRQTFQNPWETVFETYSDGSSDIYERPRDYLANEWPRRREERLSYISQPKVSPTATDIKSLYSRRYDAHTGQPDSRVLDVFDFHPRDSHGPHPLSIPANADFANFRSDMDKEGEFPTTGYFDPLQAMETTARDVRVLDDRANMPSWAERLLSRHFVEPFGGVYAAGHLGHPDHAYGGVLNTGSMEPDIQGGDLFIYRQSEGEDLDVGDKVLYRKPGGDFIFHRIVDVDSNGEYIIQGDNNEYSDPGTFTDDDIEYKNVFHIPLGKIPMINNAMERITRDLVPGHIRPLK